MWVYLDQYNIKFWNNQSILYFENKLKNLSKKKEKWKEVNCFNWVTGLLMRFFADKKFHSALKIKIDGLFSQKFQISQFFFSILYFKIDQV